MLPFRLHISARRALRKRYTESYVTYFEISNSNYFRKTARREEPKHLTMVLPKRTNLSRQASSVARKTSQSRFYTDVSKQLQNDNMKKVIAMIEAESEICVNSHGTFSTWALQGYLFLSLSSKKPYFDSVLHDYCILLSQL